mgnify:CR=1 FL=1
MRAEKFYPESNNLSVAWAQSFLKSMTRGISELSPLVVTVSDIDNGIVNEDTEIRGLIDNFINQINSDPTPSKKILNCHSVANTLFPLSMWNPDLPDDATALYKRYEKAWPTIKKCPQNKFGSYFRRLTAFQPDESFKPVNQLKHIANTYNNEENHRRSALQASVFDPLLDHSNSRQKGFPCLQQVAFAPVENNTGLSITGFYATQYLLDRAYGNYLGLCRLGRFMAKQLDMNFVRMTCIASVAKIGTPSKKQLRPLENELRMLLARREN